MRARFYNYLNLSCVISRKAEIIGSANISIGAYTRIHDHAIIQCSGWGKPEVLQGEIVIGDHCSIQPYAYLHSVGGRIEIGDYCSINPYSVLYGGGGLTIGNHVRIAAHAVIVPSNHKFDNVDVPIHLQGNSKLGILIEDDVWIGARVCILDGVKIAKGCVIGAGSIVTKSTEAYGVYVGIPARRIKDR